MTTTLRYLGPASRIRMPAHDIDAARGETFDIPAGATVDLTNEDENEPPTEVDLADYFLGDYTSGDFETVTQPYDVLDGPVDDLRESLGAGKFDGRLDALQHAEREGKDRVTAHDAINARRKHLADEGEADADTDETATESASEDEATVGEGDDAVPAPPTAGDSDAPTVDSEDE